MEYGTTSTTRSRGCESVNYEMIWFDDKSNVDFGFVVRRTTSRPGLPATVDRTLSIPGRHGQYDFGATLAPRNFLIECAFLTRDAFELQQRIMDFARFLVDSYGNPREFQLRFRERPGQYFKARYMGQFDIDRIVGTGIFSLPLTAFDPFAYSDQEQIYEKVLSQSPEVLEIESEGNVRTAPVITLINEGSTTITNLKITNEYRLE